MARKYKFRFSNVETHKTEEEVGYGGTKRVAERSARWHLKKRLKIQNTHKWYRVSVTFDGQY